MTSDQPQNNGRFRTTRWALVQAAGHSDDSLKEKALEELLVQYLPALKEFLIAKFRVSEDFADDLLQSFVLEKILKKKLIALAREERGKFRTFLLNSICNFVISELRQGKARKRIPKSSMISLDESGLDSLLAAPDELSSREFDLAFTRQVLTESVRKLQRHCERIGRKDIWEVFHCRILAPSLDDVEPESYESLVQRFQFRSPDHASNVLMSAKRMFTRVLKSVVAQYARNGAEIEEELRSLRALLEK